MFTFISVIYLYSKEMFLPGKQIFFSAEVGNMSQIHIGLFFDIGCILNVN